MRRLPVLSGRSDVKGRAGVGRLRFLAGAWLLACAVSILALATGGCDDDRLGPTLAVLEGRVVTFQGMPVEGAAIDLVYFDSPPSPVSPEARLYGREPREAPIPRTAIDGNRPNPFDETTTLSFGLSDSAAVLLEVLDSDDTRVRTLVDETRSLGVYTLSWDGLDDLGRPVPNGLYLARLRVGTPDTLVGEIRMFRQRRDPALFCEAPRETTDAIGGFEIDAADLPVNQGILFRDEVGDSLGLYGVPTRVSVCACAETPDTTLTVCQEVELVSRREKVTVVLRLPEP
jgi:hypothetical protein